MQHIAQLRLDRDRQQLQAGRRSPHFTQQALVHSGRLRPARKQSWRKPLKNVSLLILVQPAGDATPEDPPLDFVLNLIAEQQPARINSPSLLNTEVVARKSESGTQTES